MPRPNRRDDLLAAALELFADRGYEGTSVADLADATGLSKAAFVYHFGSKGDLLLELAEPLLLDLDDLMDRYESMAATERDLGVALGEYLATLDRHREVACWIDGDKSVLNHEELGARLDANNRRAHVLLAGRRPSKTTRAKASAILGMLWRPVRNGYLPDDPRARRAVVELATQAALTL